MKLPRLLLFPLGFLLPVLVRLPGGRGWLGQYAFGPGGILFFSVFHAIPLAALFGLTFAYRTRAAWLLPAVAGLGYLGWEHARLDLAADAQAAIALVFLPIYALAPVGLGAAAGFALDRVLARDKAPPA